MLISIELCIKFGSDISYNIMKSRSNLSCYLLTFRQHLLPLSKWLPVPIFSSRCRCCGEKCVVEMWQGFFSPHLCSSCVAEYPACEFRSILSIYSVYIGETGRPFVTKLNEHKKEVESKDKTKFTRQRKQSVDEQQNKSAITDHEVKENHVIGWDEASILGREGNYE